MGRIYTEQDLMSLEEVKRCVDSDGLEYAIQRSVHPKEIKDPALSMKWGLARRLLNEIEEDLRG